MEKQEQKKLRYHTFKARCKKKKKTTETEKGIRSKFERKISSAQSIGAGTKDLMLQNAVHLPFHGFVTDVMIFLLRETPLL